MESLEIFGKPDCVDFNRAKVLLEEFDVSFTFHDMLANPDAAAEALRISGGHSSPVIVFNDGSFLVEPSTRALANKLGLDAPLEPDPVGGEVCEA